MANKKLLTCLGLAVLLQLSFAIPVPDQSSEETKGKDDLEKFAIIEFNKVAASVVPREINILREVEKDLKADEKRTDGDNEVLKEIEEFIKKSDDIDKNDSDSKLPLEMFFKINAIIDPYDEVGQPSKKNPKVHDLLEKHGWRAVRDSFDAEIEPKIDELGKKVKAYYDNLGADEKKKEKALSKWIGKFDDKENDIGDKINLLLEFITLTDDDSDESK